MLEASRLSFAYPGHEALFDGVSFCVEQDERLALAAPSGFGKTTLCRVLAGYERPVSGEVALDGKPLPEAGRCPVQLIGQHPELALDPCLRMEKSLADAGEVPRGLMDKVGIRPEWLKRYPHELSGGELQRFCIARALAATPRFLIADEISTMLDALTQAQIWRFLLDETQARGIGLVFVSHSPALTGRIATRSIDLTEFRPR